MNDIRTIDCEEALRRLFEYLDAELHEESRHEMEQHLARCHSCFSRVEFERRLKTHTAALRHEPVSPAFERRIRMLLETFKR